MRRYTVTTCLAVCVGVLLAIASIGCSPAATSTPGGAPGGTPGGEATTGAGTDMGGYASVGERIFMTGVGSDGQMIEKTAPRASEGTPTVAGDGCAACHGTDGKGGTIRMKEGTDIDGPDITYSALIKAGFTDGTIRKAITDGLDEEAEKLDAAMPLWHMSETDLNATIDYMKKLGTP